MFTPASAMRDDTGMSDPADNRLVHGRAGRLLAACRTEIREELTGWAPRALADAAESFYQRAERAESTEIQTRLLAAASVLGKGERRFVDALAAGIHERFDVRLETPLPEETFDGFEQPLQLIDEEELEETLAVGDIAAKAELRYSQELFGLNRRITLLNHGRAVSSDNNPLGPAQLGGAIRAAGNALAIETPEKVALIYAFERCFMNELGDCYRRLNDRLVEAGILPNLKFDAPRAKDSPPRPRKTPPQPGQPAPDAAQPSPSSLMNEVRTESAEVVQKIRELMSRMRRPAPAEAAARPAASTETLDQALRQIQRQYAPERGEVLDTQAIKKRIARWLEEHGQTVGPEQEDTIDLMGMVYDYVRSELDIARPVQKLVEQLHVPMMRVAISDRGFLEDGNHPARRFYDTVADAGELWMDDDPGKSRTFSKVRQAVERILSDDPGDPEMYRRLLDDLRKHVALTRRRARVSEKRHVEARKGQERLASARNRAQETVDQMVGRYQPPEFAASVLKGAWVDYLALLHLRHGEDSSQWKGAVATARFLAVAMKGRAPTAMIRELRSKLEPSVAQLRAGLEQVGYGAEDIETIVNRLQQGVTWSLEKDGEDSPPEALARPVPQTSERPQVSEAQSLRDRELALPTAVKQRLARLRLTPFGTWFELRRETEGPWIKRKLSWYSPVSGHCLFVNHLGQPEEIDLITVAEMLEEDRARLFVPPKRPLMDRALNAVLGRLRKLTPK